MLSYQIGKDISNSSFVQFQIWDFPGDFDFDDPSVESDTIFKGTGSLIFVIDAQVVWDFFIYETFAKPLHFTG